MGTFCCSERSAAICDIYSFQQASKPGCTLGAGHDTPSISSFPLSEASNELYRTRLRKGRNQKLLPPVPSRHIIIPTTEASILIRIHTTTNTPDALVEGLTDTERGAIAEAHAPYEGSIVRMRRC